MTHRVAVVCRVDKDLSGNHYHVLLSTEQPTTSSNPGVQYPAYTVYHQPTLCSFIGIGSGQRQPIAVTCIAEHA